LVKRALVLFVILLASAAPAVCVQSKGAMTRKKAAGKKPVPAKAAVRPAAKKPAAGAKKTTAAAARKKAPARRRALQKGTPPSRFVAQPPVLEPLACSLRQTAPGTAVPCLNCSEQALSSAYTFTGLQYKRGGSRPETGFDCSGFVRHVFQNSCNLDLPRTAREQFEIGERVNKEDLRRGDLVFFRGRQGWHVGIYTGDGQFIHSPNRRDAVKVSSLSAAYYKRAFKGARRLTSDLLPELTPEPVLPAPDPLPVGEIPAPLITEAAGEN
jgi:cell wall-associated NlpC family hydrolase